MAVLKVALIALMVVAVAMANDTETATETEVDAELTGARAKPRKGKKLVSPLVIHSKPMMKREHIVIVPKGDPRARAPLEPLWPSSPRVLRREEARRAAHHDAVVLRSAAPAPNTAGCAAKHGHCMDPKTCTGSLFHGVCGAGAAVCCIGGSAASPAAPPVVNPTVDVGACPLGYGALATTGLKGNRGVVYQTVPIRATDLSDPALYGQSDTKADNTMRLQPTGCAFARMAEAAAKVGIKLTIASGFRTVGRQQYLYQCYRTKRCNGGNLAAVPGTSNHGEGLALDLNTDCGGQTGSRAPSACRSSRVYQWLVNNYKTTGFIRTVQVEPWHWEYRPGQALPAWAKF